MNKYIIWGCILNLFIFFSWVIYDNYPYWTKEDLEEFLFKCWITTVVLSPVIILISLLLEISI